MGTKDMFKDKFQLGFVSAETSSRADIIPHPSFRGSLPASRSFSSTLSFQKLSEKVVASWAAVEELRMVPVQVDVAAGLI